MTIRTHAHTDHTDRSAHITRSGYTTARGAQRWIDTHTDTAPTGWGYYVGSDTYTDGHAVWCAPITDTTPALATRYGVAITSWRPTGMYVETADGTGYGAPMTPTYGAPTVPATADTPTFDDDAYTCPTCAPGNTFPMDIATCTVCGDTYGPVADGTDTPVYDDMPNPYAGNVPVPNRASDGTLNPLPIVNTGTYTAPVADGNDAPTVAPSNDDVTHIPANTYTECDACGGTVVPLDTVAPGTYITIHTHTGDGHGGLRVDTIAGTVERDTINTTDTGTPWTIVRVVYPGGAWTTPRSDYRVHTPITNAMDTDDPTADTDDDPTYVTVYGRPVDARVAARMGIYDPTPWVDGPVHADDTNTYPAPSATDGRMVPGITYTGTSRNGTDYTVFTDGTITTRTYAADDGTITVTRADANHMWTADTSTGNIPANTITYVVAEGTYWRTYADGTNRDSVRVSCATWPNMATCGHSFGAYGACIAPVGHPHTDHIDANGNKFTGPAMARYGSPIGCVAPGTYVPAANPNTYASSAPGATGRTVLRDDVWRFAAMVYALTTTADMDMYDACTDADTYATYRHIVDYAMWTTTRGTAYDRAIATVAAIDAGTFLDMVRDIAGIAR